MCKHSGTNAILRKRDKRRENNVGWLGLAGRHIIVSFMFHVPHKTIFRVSYCNLTVTPYLRAIPCSVSLSETRCSMNFSPRDAATLAVLPYERIFVRARLWDSSLSDSEPDLDLGKIGCPNRPPPSRKDNTGENSAIFSWINKERDCVAQRCGRLASIVNCGYRGRRKACHPKYDIVW